ncbi:hypothetical protein JW978_03445 [Candidatus Dojkabacteria bacterium]|nr:hypothetical protein [Candidatus Dojkabacteria bacterium]
MSKYTNLLVLPAVEHVDEIVKGLSSSMKFTKGSFRKLEYIIKGKDVKLLHDGVDIREFSSVWLSSFWRSRDLSYAVKLYLEHYKIQYTFVEKATSKITDQIVFVLNNLVTPDTFFADIEVIDEHAERIEEVCGYPLIIKDTQGSRGKYSAYIENRKELLKAYAKLPKYKKYIFQKFIPNEFDWGVLVSNGEVVSAEKSYGANNEFRNNCCNGAKEIFVALEDIPEQIKKIAIKASNRLGLSWSRTDIIVDKNTGIPYLLEVNRCPGITSGTTEVSGAQKFLRAHLDSVL